MADEQAQAPQEGYLHSLATSLGIDPEAVKSTAKAIFANPKAAASEIGHEISDEASAMVQKPLETAETVGKGVADALTNPEAQATAHARISKPGFANKLAGAQEMVYSAIPLIGGGLTKAEEQATEGNVAGSLGTMTGLAAPALLEEMKPGGALERPEGSAFDPNPEAGKLKVRGRKPVALDEAKATKVSPSVAETKAAAGPKFFKDSNGVQWAEDPSGARVSIPESVSDTERADYAKTKLAEQIAMQARIRASRPEPISLEPAGGTAVMPPESPATAPMHPALQKLTDQIGAQYAPAKNAGFILPDGRVLELDESHPEAIERVTGKGGFGDNRPDFLNDTGAVRTRIRIGRDGTTLHVSVPKQGVNPEQIQSIQQAVGSIGRYGNVTMERADIGSSTANTLAAHKEFASPRDVEPMLKQIGAHPDQAEEVSPKGAVSADAEKPVVHELNADEEPANLHNTKVVDDAGKPVTLYHGTNANFQDFSAGHEGETTQAKSAQLGHFFTENPNVAKQFGKNVRQVNLDIRNPIDLFETPKQYRKTALGGQTPLVRTAGDRSSIGNSLGHKIDTTEVAKTGDAHEQMKRAVAKIANKPVADLTAKDYQQYKEHAIALGYDGIRLKDALMDSDGQAHTVWIAFKDDQVHPIGGAVTPNEAEEVSPKPAASADAEKPNTYEIGDEEPATQEAPAPAPNEALQGSAQKYAEAKGMEPIDHSPVEQDPERARELARQYHEAEDAPNDPQTAAAYDALKKETKDQFHHLRDDLGLKFEPQEADPYQSAGEMMDDVRKNNRLKVFTGSSTGPEHPLSEIDPETGHSYNTLFRWVHDALGHAAGGFDFSENGEKSATEAHAQMYSDEARPAMRAETEGQTSWFFHNPDVESGSKPIGDFAPQKATIIPDEGEPAGRKVTYLENPRARSMRDAPVYKNDPARFKENYGSGQEWYHGTTADFQDFKHEGIERGTTDWNSRLGTHFSEDSSVAQEFAEGKYSGKSEGGRVIAAKLKIQNPKFYQFEGDMGDAALKNALDKGIVTLSDVRKVKPDFDPAQTYNEGNGIINALRNKRGAIGNAFKTELKAQGHDGIVYGNVVEGGFGHNSAIAFEPEQIEQPAKGDLAGGEEGDASFNPEVEAGTKPVGDFAPQKATTLPDNATWHQTAGDLAAKNDAGGIDPRTGKTDSTGKGVEIMPELRQPLDHAPTPADFQNFYQQHKEIFDKNPELRVGWDNNSAAEGGHELNIAAVGDEAARVAKKLDQKSAFDIDKGENIDTKGSGTRTEFPNYPLEERMKDLRGEPQSDIKGFEHLSKDFYDNLEPDEREYLQGNKTLQRNAMAQYHKLEPSVPETTNAMQAGAALGGWWKRYIDVFHGLVDTPPEVPADALWHGTPSGDLRGGTTGLHVGTRQAAKEALEARIGIRADGKDWDGTQEYGKTLLAGRKTLEKLDPSRMRETGYNVHIPEEDHYSTGATYSDGTPVEPTAKPNLMPVKITGPMTNRPTSPISDSAANTRLRRQLSKGTATKGVFYRNEGEDFGSISAALPSGSHIEQIANTIGPSHAEVLKQWHAALSGNKAVEDANNIAWHSYADWLDAGKPTDRKSINDIIQKNGAQPEGSAKKGNAAISDTLNRRGKVVSPGLDTTKLFNLVNSPEMRGERPFTGDVFNDDKAKNPLMGTTEGARKIPSMGATVAGKGNLNRLVIDTHIRDFYGQPSSGPAAQYIADSVHLRQAAEALGLKGSEGQEQLWGTVLGLKTLLKEGLTPAEAGGTLSARIIQQIGKDYAEVIANDPEITGPGGVLDRLKEKYNIGRGAAGVGEAYRKTLGSGAGESQPAGSETAVSPTLIEKTAGRIRKSIADVKIKKPASGGDLAGGEEGDTSFNFSDEEPKPTKPKAGGRATVLDLIKALDNLKNPAK